MAGDTLPHAKFGSDPKVWCNGVFYYITEMPYGVVTFDPENGIWTELDAAMPCSISTPSLAESNGRLMMVGKVVNMLIKLLKKYSSGNCKTAWAVIAMHGPSFNRCLRVSTQNLWLLSNVILHWYVVQ